MLVQIAPEIENRLTSWSIATNKLPEDFVNEILKEALEDWVEPASYVPSGEFDDCILADLIEEGYEGKNLLAEFNARRSKIRPAAERLMQEADNVSRGIGEYFTYEDVFGE